jgi:hypothetical protein
VDTVSLCPLAVGSVLWQPDATGWTLSAVVKATFSLEHGKEPILTDAQDPIGGDRFFADDKRFSLATMNDLVPFKPRVDVTLVGHAFAPGMKPVEALVARLCVGDLDKSVGLVGDRVWVDGPDGMEPAAPTQFVKMPLRWERAARSADNPVGLDLTAAPVGGALALPNLEPVEDEEGGGLAVGFGPIAPAWGARRRRLSAGHATWADTLEGPAPAGFDFGFFNAAPADQQIELLRYGSRIELSHLHPRVARLETRVPALRPKAFLVHARTGKAEELSLRCDTLAIDTDRSVLTLTWRGLCSLAGGRDDVGTLVVAIETKGKEIRYKQIEALVRDGALSSVGADALATEERNPMSVRHDSVKPGGPAPPVIPARAPAEPPPRRSRKSQPDSSGPPESDASSPPSRNSQPAKEEAPASSGKAAAEQDAPPGKRTPTVTSTEVKQQVFEEGNDPSTQDESTIEPADRDP